MIHAQKIQMMNYGIKRGKGPHIAIGDKVLKKDFRHKREQEVLLIQNG